MNKKILVTLVSIFAIGVIASSISADSQIPKDRISQGFEKIKTEMNSQAKSSSSIPLVEGDGLRIMPEKYVFFKNSMELINSLQNDKSNQITLTDEEIINNLATEELTVKYAKEMGITVSNEEINEVINNERKALSQENDPDNDLVRELMKNRIKITGMSEDEFWNSEMARDNYERAILLGKLMDELIKNKAITNARDFEDFKSKLFEKKKNNLKINKEAIIK